MTSAHLLLVEDSEDDAFLVIRCLRQGGLDLTFERVETAQAMLAQLRTHTPDLVISDGKLPAFDAHEALQLLRGTGMDVPFILVSGQIGEESAAALMRAGARDFVLKDNLARLVPAVCRELDEAHVRHHSREVQAALHTMEERFRLVAEHLQDIVFRLRLTPSPQLEYISPAITTLTGIPAEELYQDPDRLLRTARPEDRRRLHGCWYSPTPQRYVLRWDRLDGSSAWVEQRTNPVFDHHHRLIAVEGILRDITEQTQAEEARRELEHKLHQAERLDSLGHLSGGIAHDFNNLLGVIKGYAGLVLDSLPGDHPCRSDIEGIDRAAVQGAALTRQLLIFSRLQPSQPETLDINTVINESCVLLHRTIGADITFVIDLQSGLPAVTIDRSRLEQIVMNLVVNSRAAMPDGGTITIRTSPVEVDENGPNRDLVPGRYVRLSVQDTGHGMPPEVAQRAFEPFYSTKEPGTGTGLGLSTVYGVVTDAGGTLALWSEPGNGTRLTIHLPSGERQAPAAVTDDEPAPAGHGTRILVVDDNLEIAAITARILNNAGYRATLATSRDAALAALARSPAALVLADLVMPGMTARDFVTAIHRTAPGAGVLLMSGHSGDRTGDGNPPLPDLPMIRKPFGTAQLLHRIHACLQSEPALLS